MISRVWHGWTKREHANQYEGMLRAEVLPGFHRVPGYQGAYLLRRDDGDEVEFVTITIFDDMDAVRRFAGDDYTRAVIHPPARRILTRFDGALGTLRDGLDCGAGARARSPACES